MDNNVRKKIKSDVNHLKITFPAKLINYFLPQ
mgnify:CR=1 FL=1